LNPERPATCQCQLCIREGEPMALTILDSNAALIN
jgi:hypothetical protein